MKSIRQHQAAQQAIQPVVNNVHFNALVGNAYINSVHNSTSHVEIDMQILQDIDVLSAPHPALKEAATAPSIEIELSRRSPVASGGKLAIFWLADCRDNLYLESPA